MQARVAQASAMLGAVGLLLAACGPRVARETIFDESGVRVILRSEQQGGKRLARGFAHPVTIAPVRAANILSRLDVRPAKGGESAREPAVPAELLYAMGEGLARGLAKADSTQEVVVLATRRERRLGIFTRQLLTSFVAYADGDRLQISLSHLDWPVPKEERDRLPEPWPGKAVMRFRVIANEAIVPTGVQTVSVAWRDPVFGSPRTLRVSPSGEVLRRTILMESVEQERPAGGEAPAEVPSDLAPDTLRQLADLEEARRSGEITEAEYQTRRREILADDPGRR